MTAAALARRVITEPTPPPVVPVAPAPVGIRHPEWPVQSRPFQGSPACDAGGYGDDGHG